MAHRGVDLSHWNSPVDFGTMKRAGIEFVALKATEGDTYADPTFSDRQARARAVGLAHVLFYHFFDPTRNPSDQGIHFAHVVRQLQPGEIVVIDVEAAGGWDRLTPEQSANSVLEFVAAVKAHLTIPARQVMLYGSLGWLRGQFGDSLRDLTFMPLWAARYAPQLGDVTPWTNATIWQTSERGTVAGGGAPGTADLDTWLAEGAWE